MYCIYMQRTSSPTLTNTTQPNPGVGGDAPIVYPLTPQHPSPAYSCCSLLLYRVSWHHDAEGGQFLKVCCRILSFSCPLGRPLVILPYPKSPVLQYNRRECLKAVSLIKICFNIFSALNECPSLEKYDI